MNNWALIRCLGEDNLMQAISDYEEEGWNIFSIVHMGFTPVQKKLTLNQEPELMARYLLIARRPQLGIQNGKH